MEKDSKADKVNSQPETKKEEIKNTENKKVTEKKTSSSRKSYAILAIIVIIIVGALAVLYGGFYANSDTTGAMISDGQILMSQDQDITAQVNGENIYTNSFNDDVSIYLFLQGVPASYRDQIPEEQLIDNTVTEKLLLQEAQKQGYSTNSSEAETILSQNPSFDMEQFLESLNANNINYDSFIDYVQRQITINSFITDSITSNVIVTEQELKDFYDQNSDAFITEEQISASHILVNTKEEAEDLIKKLGLGENFATLAKENSIGPSATVGGDLGYFGVGAMVPEFETAAFSLKAVGEYTETPVQTEFGYHVIMLTGKKNAKMLSFSDVKEQLSGELLTDKQNTILTSYVKSLKENADVVVY
ncbi:MAG: peptidylprolyl isomerase [Candidatus Aenigmatarchaeota archaeon]